MDCERSGERFLLGGRLNLSFAFIGGFLRCLILRAHWDRCWWWNEGTEILGQFLKVDVEGFGRYVEVVGMWISVRGRRLSDSGTEIKFFRGHLLRTLVMGVGRYALKCVDG